MKKVIALIGFVLMFSLLPIFALAAECVTHDWKWMRTTPTKNVVHELCQAIVAQQRGAENWNTCQTEINRIRWLLFTYQGFRYSPAKEYDLCAYYGYALRSVPADAPEPAVAEWNMPPDADAPIVPPPEPSPVEPTPTEPIPTTPPL